MWLAGLAARHHAALLDGVVDAHRALGTLRVAVLLAVAVVARAVCRRVDQGAVAGGAPVHPVARVLIQAVAYAAVAEVTLRVLGALAERACLTKIAYRARGAE